MKKIIIALSILAASTLGLAAQTQNKTAGQPDKEYAKKHADGKKQKKAADPFAGLNLTEQQRQKLTDLRAQSKAGKAANDSTERARRAEHAAKAKTMRADYLKNVKAILTPEQYVMFLENNYINAAPGHKKGHRGVAFGKGGQKHKKHDKNKDMSRAKKDNSKKKS